MWPLTQETPKPLLRVGDKPILEHVLCRLKDAGVGQVTLAIAHLGSKIEAYFGSGDNFGVEITYLYEDIPLGTAGALSRLQGFDQPFYMMNGDLLTDLDFHLLMAEHVSHRAILTVASKVMYTDLGLGVIDIGAGGRVAGYREKPRLEHRFGLGIYVVDPSVRVFVPPNVRLDMPDLVNSVISSGEIVASYDHRGDWVDIGTPHDYARAGGEHWAVNDVKAARTFAGSTS